MTRDPKTFDDAIKHDADFWTTDLVNSVEDDLSFDLCEQDQEKQEQAGFPGSGRSTTK